MHFLHRFKLRDVSNTPIQGDDNNKFVIFFLVTERFMQHLLLLSALVARKQDVECPKDINI